jgi:hypothetical protein
MIICAFENSPSIPVTYAPEYESVEETREKLQDRRKAVAARLRILGKVSMYM